MRSLAPLGRATPQGKHVRCAKALPGTINEHREARTQAAWIETDTVKLVPDEPMCETCSTLCMCQSREAAGGRGAQLAEAGQQRQRAGHEARQLVVHEVQRDQALQPAAGAPRRRDGPRQGVAAQAPAVAQACPISRSIYVCFSWSSSRRRARSHCRGEALPACGDDLWCVPAAVRVGDTKHNAGHGHGACLCNSLCFDSMSSDACVITASQ